MACFDRQVVRNAGWPFPTMDRPGLSEVLAQIIEVSPSLHSATTFPANVLGAIARHASRRLIERSAETGSGASTLLFSHLSEHHTVFALDGGSGSVGNVISSPLLRENVVRFVEGPTQQTLPRQRFEEKFQAILLDGPHGYPFPDLEYFFLYPHLDTGGLLILDDIHIPTINHLFQFLRRDAMFDLDEVVHTTAFFTRSEAPTFDPLGDGWWRQGANRKTLFRYLWKQRLKALIPPSVRRPLSRHKRRRLLGRHSQSARIRVDSPKPGVPVEKTGIVEGRATLPPGASLWVLVRREGLEGWWPQGGGPVPVKQGRWRTCVKYGEQHDQGHDFEICAIAVQRPTQELWRRWVERAAAGHSDAPVSLPAAEFVMGECMLRVRKIGLYP